MNEWRLQVATLDMDWEWGFAVGQYTKDGQPIKRHAIRFAKHATNDEVADQLRAMADYIEQKMGVLNER